MQLIGREFAGQIVAGNDPKNRGRYKVLINELMYNIYDKDEGFIYCVNHVCNHRNTNCDNGIYGQYLPLQSGTKVIVKFYTNDLETAYIDRIVSDYYENSMPLGIPTTDRDQYYQLLRTIANDLISVTAGTSGIPAGGMHLYHKGDNVQLVFDTTGIHIYTKKDLDEQIDGEASIKINGNVTCKFDADLSIQVSGNTKITTGADCEIVSTNTKITSTGNCEIVSGGATTIMSTGGCQIISSSLSVSSTGGGSCSIESKGPCNIVSQGPCNIDSTSSVNINCGLGSQTPANPVSPASPLDLPDKDKTPLISFDSPITPIVKI
jgi:hypothetical protein